MFCPNCRGEYREGFSTCAHCDVPLVAELEPIPKRLEPNAMPLVPVLSTPNEATILVARSLLDDAGIPYVTKNEQLQDLLGLGRIGGYNILVGPIVLQVRSDDVDTAREILRQVERVNGTDDETPDVSTRCSAETSGWPSAVRT